MFKKAFAELDRVVSASGASITRLSPSKSQVLPSQAGDSLPQAAQARALAGSNPFLDDIVAASGDVNSDGVVDELPQNYFSATFDPVQHELLQLPGHVDQQIIEELVDARTHALEVVTERLSTHVLANYDKFVDGINEVGSIESHLQSAVAATKVSRQLLAQALRQVTINILIGTQTRRKQALVKMLDLLLRLQQADNLHHELQYDNSYSPCASVLREHKAASLLHTQAQENVAFSEAFWLCAQCLKSMEELQELSVTEQITMTIHQQYQELVQRMEAAFQTVCNDFDPEHYSKVLEGYIFVDNIDQLGNDIKTAFTAAINNAVVKVVRGVLLTRTQRLDDSHQAAEGVTNATSLQELVKQIPNDLFRTCLANVLMIAFDVMASHYRMATWHRINLEKHALELSRIQKHKADLKHRLGIASPAADPSPRQQAATPSTPPGNMPASTTSTSTTPAQQSNGAQPAQEGAGTIGHSLPSHQANAMPPAADGSSAGEPLTPRRGLRGPQGGEMDSLLQELPLPAQLEDLETKERDELEWGTVLQVASSGLEDARKLLWDETARKIGILLASQMSFKGEHFVQVLDWTQRIIAIGEAFSGVQSEALRTSLQRQSGTFFRGFHRANMEALLSMLEQEQWRRLPTAANSSLRESLTMDQGPSQQQAASPGPALAQSPRHLHKTETAKMAFEHWLAAGNPWRIGHRRRQTVLAVAHRDETKAGVSLSGVHHVDEYGVKVAMDSLQPVVEELGEEASSSESEPEDVFADYIDEDTQQAVFADRVARSRAASTSADAANGTGVNAMMTTSSWRTLRWMKEYAQLIKTLRPVASAVFGGIAELFELYMLHIFATFGDVSVGQLLMAHTHGQAHIIKSDSLTPRLRSTLIRIVTDGLSQHQDLLRSHPGLNLDAPPPPTVAGLSSGAVAVGAAVDTALQRFREKHLGASTVGNTVAGGADRRLPDRESELSHSKVSNSGNLYGLRERMVAVESLMALASELTRARAPLMAVMPQTEAAALDFFFQRTVASAADVRDSILRVGARLNLPLGWLPDAIASTIYLNPEPPVRHNAWVDQLLGAVRMFRDRLAAVDGLGTDTLEQLWEHAVRHIAEHVLEGISKVRKCNLEGRAGMSVDLQALNRGLQQAAPPSTHVNLRLVDTYVKGCQDWRRSCSQQANILESHRACINDITAKGFYIPATELRHWAATHPEFTREQVLALVTLISDNAGYKRKDRLALLQLIEADLNSLEIQQ